MKLTTLEDAFSPIPGLDRKSGCGCGGDGVRNRELRHGGINNSTQVNVNVGTDTNSGSQSNSGRTRAAQQRDQQRSSQPSSMSTPPLPQPLPAREIVRREPYPVPVFLDRVKTKVKTVFRDIVRPYERRIVEKVPQPIPMPYENRVIQKVPQPISMPYEKRVVQKVPQPVSIPYERRVTKTRYVKETQPALPSRTQGNKYDNQQQVYYSFY